MSTVVVWELMEPLQDGASGRSLGPWKEILVSWTEFSPERVVYKSESEP